MMKMSLKCYEEIGRVNVLQGNCCRGIFLRLYALRCTAETYDSLRYRTSLHPV